MHVHIREYIRVRVGVHYVYVYVVYAYTVCAYNELLRVLFSQVAC